MYLEKKLFWNPPNLAFPIVWTILYKVMPVSLCEPKAYSSKVFSLFFEQMFLNMILKRLKIPFGRLALIEVGIT